MGYEIIQIRFITYSIYNKSGWGPFHYFIIGLCAMSTMTEAAASMTILIAMELLMCDLNYDKKDILTFSAVLSLGMALGNLIFGTLADYNGRKCLIPTSMIVIFCATIGLSFSQTYFTIGLSIFVYGIGAAGNYAILRLYLIECLPAKKRGKYLAIIDLIWMIGYIFALGNIWLLMPSAILMLGDEFRPNSWRVFAGLAGAPNLIMACATSLLPRSPRYLIHHRHPEEAFIVLQHMFAVNTSQHVTTFSPINFDNCHSINDDEISNGSLVDMTIVAISKIWRRIICIFSCEFIEDTLLFMLIRLLLFPGFIWVAVWKTQIFTHENVMCENSTSITNETCNINADMNLNYLKNCHNINDTRIKYLFMFFSSFILGESLLAFGIDIIGRRLPLVISGLVGATTILASTLTKSQYVKIVLSIIFLTSYSILNTATNIVQLENYPTAVRGTAVGLSYILPHLVSCTLKLCIEVTSLKTLHIAFGLLIGTSIAVIPILDLSNAPMRE